MAIFENIDLENYTPFKSDFIASVSSIWETAKILGVNHIICEYIRQEKCASHTVMLRFFKNQKKSGRILVAEETLSFSHNGSKSINYVLL